MDFGFILYIGIVVGNVPNLKHMITGGRTYSAIPLSVRT